MRKRCRNHREHVILFEISSQFLRDFVKIAVYDEGIKSIHAGRNVTME